MALAVGTALGTYHIVAFIGAGGMGEVYRARDGRLGREVALKMLPEAFACDSDRLARFDREARVLASLNHPNIATIHGVEEAGDIKALVLEFVDGSTLAELIAEGPLPVAEAIAIGAQIAQALEAAHAAGVVHRDLKPANIKVHTGRVKVLDFGLAKALDVDEARAPLSHSPTVTSPAATRHGVILGTAAYMAPEQARGEAVDEQADIWACGCVLFESLIGRPPFEGRSVSDIIAAILRSEPEWSLLPGNLHPRVRMLLERCLEKNSAQRYHTIADARVDLQKAMADPAGFSAPVPRRGKTLSIPWYWAAALVAVVAAIVGATMWGMSPARDRSLVRFSDVLPQNNFFTNVGHPLIAISPDAVSVAYVAANRLFLRPQDRVEASPISGTEGAPTTPFFSPDGQFLGYFDFAQGELRRIPVAGGTPVTLAKVTNVFGARWNIDDTILYGADTGVWRISARGGPPEAVVRLIGGERMHAPQLLPGGESVLFTLRPSTGSVQWRQAQIVVQSLRTGERKIIRAGRDARYLPTGHIVYAADNTLFAMRFDVNRLEAVDAPIPVAEGLRFATSFPGMTGTANYDISSNGVLVYVQGSASAPVLRRLVAVDRSGNAEPLVTQMHDYWRPRISPDGSRIAVEVDDEAGAQLFIVNVKAGTATPLNTGGSNVYCCSWTFDGRFVIYRDDREDGYGLFRQPPDGSDSPQLLYRATEDLMPGDVSREGVLVFASGEQTGRRSILTIRIGEPTAMPFLVTPALEHMPTFSPDGRWIAYASNESGRSEIYIRPYPPSDKPARRISDAGGTAPLWSPRGSELFYRSAAGNMMAVPLQADTAIPAGRAQELFRAQGRFRFSGNTAAYDVEPNGQRFIMVTEPENAVPARQQIVVVRNWFEELNRLVPATR
jgi:serine/threonine protein kinase